MRELIGDYESAVARAEDVLHENGIDMADLVQCDTICYRVETNERYDELKRELARVAMLLNEVEVNGRLIVVYALEEPLVVGNWNDVSYIEVPQPKPGSHYPEGIDHVQFVTRLPLSKFRAKYSDTAFEEKGLANKLNPLLKLEGEQVSVKFHDKHMGAVVELEGVIYI